MSWSAIFPKPLILMAVLSAGAIAAWMLFVVPPETIGSRESLVGERPEESIPATKLLGKEMPRRLASEFDAGAAEQLQRSILASLGTGKFEDRQKALGADLRELVETSPAAASALADSQEAGAVRDEMIARVARIWAEADPDRAWQWASRLADGDERRRTRGEVALQMAAGQPDRAAEMAVAAGLSQVLEPIIQRWAAEDLDGARDWASAQPAGPARDVLMQGVVMAVAERSPDEAASIVSGEFPPGKAQEEAAMAVLHRWAREDPAEARRWGELFPEGALRKRVLHELDGMPSK